MNNEEINEQFIKYENTLNELRSENEYFKEILRNKNQKMLMYNFITGFVMAVVGCALTLIATMR